MNNPGDGTSATPAATPVATPIANPASPAAAKPDGHGLGWPVCRCGHPMHPEELETRRGIPMERFCCPKRRWWNAFMHPHIWEAPRE